MDNINDEQVRVLTLNDDEHVHEELFRLKKGWIIQIVLSSRLSWRKVRIFTNIPLNENDQFVRHHYQELKWICPSSEKCDDSNRYVLIRCSRAGTFDYYLTIDETKRTNGGYFQVEPEFIWPDGSGEVLRQECIACQTVLSKSLGPMCEWTSRLRVSDHSGYNMIHFTPFQVLSNVSNSSYSIKDHHQLNPLFEGSFEELKRLVDLMAKDWRLLSISDLVYNHVGNDCSLFVNHPECAFNLINSPHLKPAVLLDSILMQFSRDITDEKLLSKGISSQIKGHHFQFLRHYLISEQIPKYRLWEYYICDVDSLVEQFREQLSKLEDCPQTSFSSNEELIEIEHGKYLRMKSSVNLQLAEEVYYFRRENVHGKDQWINGACDALKVRLQYLNEILLEKVNENVNRAIDNCLSTCRYRFLSNEGPRHEQISFPSRPFVESYFHYPQGEVPNPDQLNDLIENDLHYQSYVMAHNGWVVNDDPLRCFADEGEDVYFRRELVVWCDLIKVRFGSSSEDCPVLYSYMKEYTRLIATTFHGCRLDNCHSTPLWLAQQMMDYAREINPNFYVNAELFIGNTEKEIHFINRIGINSLVRESYRSSHLYGLGEMVSWVSESDPIGSFIQSKVRPLLPSPIYSWFYDQTHDNPSLIERSSVEDILPRSSIVAMAHCSTGSNRGYDELVPHYIDVVHETRFYAQWGEQSKQVNGQTAIISIKKALNQLHIHLAQQGFHQLMVDQLSSTSLLLTRHNPQSHQSVLLICHTSFKPLENLLPLVIDGFIDHILFEGSVYDNHGNQWIEHFCRSTEYINGLEDVNISFKENLSLEESTFVRLTTSNSIDYSDYRILQFTKDFRPGSIIALQISLLPQMRQSLMHLKEFLNQFSNPTSEFNQIVKELTLVDLQRVLYRTSLEEQSDGNNWDVYSIPNYGQMIYCGLQGQMSVLEKLRLHNNVRHPLIVNLKEGNWLMNYICVRLQSHPRTKQLGDWYAKAFEYLNCLSRVIIPTYFDLIITGSYSILLEHGWTLMTPFVNQSSTFIRALAQASIQLISVVADAPLPLLSPNLRSPKPTGQCPSLAAGFPHFSSGIWRNWGRDTFISLRGLLLLTGRYEEARYLILSYGGCLRHGLIPNLLGDGKVARYNARDAVWWWLYSISSYTDLVPDGHHILSDLVSRLYPRDDSSFQEPVLYDQPLFDVINEVLLRHLQSLIFRERGAGHDLDGDMTDEGFNNRIGVDRTSGFVFGGNQWNCGTWMDKMGSSDKAKNKGYPATSRDGSPVELVGLSRATLAWLIRMNKQGYYPYDSIQQTSSPSDEEEKVFLDQWLNRIDQNFEKQFWIDQANSSQYVNRTQIYKDTVNSSSHRTDFQFRPNFLVAAVLAPEMFDKTHIWLALEQVETILLGKYGMKTLDPSDEDYFGDYITNDDSDNPKRAHGFNYHNGPEWLWLTGYYIRAKLYWSKEQNDPRLLEQTVKHVRQIISSHMELLFSNDWKGLPELTDTDGKPCPHSCSVQAWSSATLLEALNDLTRS